MGDDPFAVKLEPAQLAALTVATQKVMDAVSIPVGVDAAFNDYAASLSIARATGAQFVRVTVFVDTVVYYGGIINPCARDCMLYRKALGCQDIVVLADVQAASAIRAAACGADAVIVTGTAIGVETPIQTIEQVKKHIKVPVIAGSGVNAGNIRAQLAIADGAIIGTSMKEGGILNNPISELMARELVSALRA
jgi:hypothetical protein